MKTTFAAAALLLCVASPAYATSVLSDATGAASCDESDGSYSVLDADACSFGTFDMGYHGVSAAVDYTNHSVSASASWFPFDGIHGAATTAVGEATLTYYFQVLGPADGVPVPIIIAADLHAGPYSHPGASIYASLAAAGVGIGVDNSAGHPGHQDFTGNLSTIVNTGEIQEVILTAYDHQQPSPFGGGNATASATIFIDPNFADADKYTIQFSRGISGLVPEPATWAMFLLGFGAIGFAMRRGRENVLSA